VWCIQLRTCLLLCHSVVLCSVTFWSQSCPCNCSTLSMCSCLPHNVMHSSSYALRRILHNNWYKQAFTHCQPLSRVDLHHPSQQLLCTARYVGWDMKVPTLDLLQKYTQVVIIKWQCPLWAHTANNVSGHTLCSENSNVWDSPPREHKEWHHNSTHLPFSHHNAHPVYVCMYACRIVCE